MNDKQQLATLGEEVAERESLVKEGYDHAMRILSAGHDTRHLVNWLRLSGNDGLTDPFDEGVARALSECGRKQQLAALGEEMVESLTDEGVAVATPTASLLAAAALLNTCRPYVASAAIGNGFGYETALLSEMDKWVGAVSFESDRRVAACLSACEGFDTAYLERAQFDSGYLPEAIHAATQRQRDELLAVLEEVLLRGVAYPSAIEQDDYGMDFEKWAEKARAVANKARGKV